MPTLNKGELLAYIRDEKGRRFGAIIAIDDVHMGWSILHDHDMVMWCDQYLNFDANHAIGEARKKALSSYSTFEDWEDYILTTVRARIPGYIQGASYWEEKAIEEFPKLYNCVYSGLVKMKERMLAYYKKNN